MPGPHSPTACPTCWAATARAMPASASPVLGAGHSAIGTLIDLAQTQGRRAGDRRSSGCCAATMPGRRSAAARPTARRARRAGCGLRRLVAAARSGVRDGISGDPRSARRRAPARSQLARRLRARRHRRTSWLSPPACGPSSISCASCACARSGAREPAGAGAADRSQRAQLRHRAAAWRARARASRAGLLHRRHQVLRPRAHLPAERPATSRSARSPPSWRAIRRRRATSSWCCPRPACAAARPVATSGRLWVAGPTRPAAAAARRLRQGRDRGRPHRTSAITRRLLTVIVLGSTQTLAWASSYYLPAILADDIARDTGGRRPGCSRSFSVSLIISARAGATRRPADRRGAAMPCWRRPTCCSPPALSSGHRAVPARPRNSPGSCWASAWGLASTMPPSPCSAASMAPVRVAPSPASPCSPASPAPSAGRSRHGAPRPSAGATPASPGRRCTSSSPCR